MKKKLLAVLLTGVMAASFAGTATVVSADSGDDNTLTVWAWDQNFNIKSMQMAGEQYAKDHEGFSVDIIETSSDDCQTKLTTAANAGDYSTLPDIVLMQDNSYQKYLTISLSPSEITFPLSMVTLEKLSEERIIPVTITNGE